MKNTSESLVYTKTNKSAVGMPPSSKKTTPVHKQSSKTSVRVNRIQITEEDNFGWIDSGTATTKNQVEIKEHHEDQLKGSIYGRELLLRQKQLEKLSSRRTSSSNVQRQKKLSASMNLGRTNETTLIGEQVPEFTEDKKYDEKLLSVKIPKERNRRPQSTRDLGSPKNGQVKKKRAPPKRLESTKSDTNVNTVVNTTTPVTPVFEEGKNIALSSIDSLENVKSSNGLLTNNASKDLFERGIS